MSDGSLFNFNLSDTSPNRLCQGSSLGALISRLVNELDKVTRHWTVPDCASLKCTGLLVVFCKKRNMAKRPSHSKQKTQAAQANDAAETETEQMGKRGQNAMPKKSGKIKGKRTRQNTVITAKNSEVEERDVSEDELLAFADKKTLDEDDDDTGDENEQQEQNTGGEGNDDDNAESGSEEESDEEFAQELGYASEDSEPASELLKESSSESEEDDNQNHGEEDEEDEDDLSFEDKEGESEDDADSKRQNSSLNQGPIVARGHEGEGYTQKQLDEHVDNLSSDDEAPKNTIKNVPKEWYNDYDHIGKCMNFGFRFWGNGHREL